MTDGRRDFEWIYGSWHVRHRKLVDVADPDCDEWVEFDGSSTVHPGLDGLGHVDYLTCPEAPGGGRLEGLTVRLFNPTTENWTIYWVSSRLPGQLDVPVVGRFEGPLGVFETDDVINGLPTRIRYLWDCADTAAPRWQQSFSHDGGNSWRPNWQMLLRRPAAVAPEHSDSVVGTP